MWSYPFAVLLALRFFLCGTQESFRLAGPERVLHNSRLEPRYGSFTAKSLLICYASCLEAATSCDAFSFNSESFWCDLVPRGAEATVVSDVHWLTVILIQQQVSANSSTSATTTPTSPSSETPMAMTTTSATTATTMATTTSSSTTEAITTTVPTTTPFACPTDFTNYNSKCYYLERNVQQSIANAQADCSGRSAELLSIETAGEQEFIRLLINGAGLYNNFWTSGKGTGSGAYMWASTSRLLEYTNFANGFPGGNYGTDSCIYLQGPTAYKWQLDSCTGGVNRYICEYPKTM